MRKDEIKLINNYWNALNYLAVGQLYLMDNPLLKRPLELKDVKPNVVGHWGTVPSQNLIYTHLNRIIRKYDLNMLYISGPGHGGNAPVAGTYLEGSYTEIYPEITQDEIGMQKLFKSFSFPGGISSHAAPETPGSIHEGGELGYSLAHAYGAILDNPTLIAATVVGDGEAETGPLATSWFLNKFINPEKDGVILPILNLNGFKINNPAILSRISKNDLHDYFKGMGYYPYYVNEKNVFKLHRRLAEAFDAAVRDINYIKENYKKFKNLYWPLIILDTPKGMTGPKEVVGTYKAHQIPFQVRNENSLKLLESWLKSYKPEELFDSSGKPKKEIKNLNPAKKRLMGLNPATNGGLLLKDLKLPDFKDYGIKINKPGEIVAQDMLELGKYLKDVFKLNRVNENFRIFGPDEAVSNRLTHIFETENKTWLLKKFKEDEMLSADGRILDGFLSEHVCQGALEGYLLTGRHGLIHSYEAFVRIVDSMTSQHAKWLKVTRELPWRQPISSLNYILTSHIWQQDHNGYTHQEPGFLNHVATKKADTVRIYLPYDANSLICSVDHILQTKDYINVVVASKHPKMQWLSMKDTIKHCTKGIDIWKWASTNDGKNPDIILTCAGDTPTLEVLAAVLILKKEMPKLKIRVINVIDLFKLESNKKHPHGLTDKNYDMIFTKNKPIIFVFHGYSHLIHQLTYNRTNKEMHVRGYIEEGTITTPFDMRVQNHIDRYHIILDVLKYTKKENKQLEDYINKMLKKHKKYIKEKGEDMPEITDWKWE